ncbi:hypothetical protein [Dyella kyungheensis]|jgi:uncharacterized membrane protein|uniref:Uncharacterized protein n=1 Tax=Dyella kyungheensis TaxID=1242174 RepID=A0ABS2JTS5_9GAMM|nr:hypothetical protein [Dyella kyungheensis]MBM7121873.1 hypothetical protein [Dyella kyungheensis]
MSEHSSRRIRQDIVLGLKLGASMIVVALLLALARRQGWIDQTQVVRAFNIVLGLGFAAYSNLLPKMYGPPPRSLRHATLAQAVRRVTSWTMTLAFLIWSVLWIFAPQQIASIASVAVVIAAIAISLGYLVWKAAGGHTSKTS